MYTLILISVWLKITTAICGILRNIHNLRLFLCPSPTGSFPLQEGQKEAASRQMTLDPVWLCIIQSFAFACGYVWYSALQYLYCCLFWVRWWGESLYWTTGKASGSVGVWPSVILAPTMDECTFTTVERLNRKQKTKEDKYINTKITNTHTRWNWSQA